MLLLLDSWRLWLKHAFTRPRLHAPVHALVQFTPMPPRFAHAADHADVEWRPVKRVGMTVEHFKTRRRGVITYIAKDKQFMVIDFGSASEPCEEWRRYGAFVVPQ